MALKAVFIIVDWDKIQVISEVVAKGNAVCYVSKGHGTADSELLDLLGLGRIDKAVFVCFIESSQMQSLIHSIRRAMGTRSTGAGIAFSVHLSGTSLPILKLFESMAAATSAKPTKKEPLMASLLSQKDKESIEIKNDMIISVLNAGYSDGFMKLAVAAGARGGTVISARGLSSEKVKSFLGLSLQEEKEIVIILAASEDKVAIMNSVSTEFGISSQAAGLIFSLPVDQVMSLNALSA
jgi:nitrogen regulatory protein PII